MTYNQQNLIDLFVQLRLLVVVTKTTYYHVTSVLCKFVLFRKNKSIDRLLCQANISLCQFRSPPHTVRCFSVGKPKLTEKSALVASTLLIMKSILDFTNSATLPLHL
ncbi:hypothetical protein QTP88_024204 [Uroleucon formosanum]